MHNKNYGPDAVTNMPTETAQPPVLPLRLDLDKYLPTLDDVDLTEDQKAEILQALWNIMRTMAEIGWGVSHLQLFSEAAQEKLARDSDKLLQQTDPLSFNQAASQDAGKVSSHD